MEENLNIEYHTKRLILLALNKRKTLKEAANVLGISDRNLHRLKGVYNIKWNDVTNEYYLLEDERIKRLQPRTLFGLQNIQSH